MPAVDPSVSPAGTATGTAPGVAVDTVGILPMANPVRPPSCGVPVDTGAVGWLAGVATLG